MNSIPSDKQQALTSSDDELVGGSINRNDERDNGLSKDFCSVDTVGGRIHAEDLSANDVNPEQVGGCGIEERSLTNQVHGGSGDLFNLVCFSSSCHL